MNTLKSLPGQLRALCSSPKFFYITVGLLVAQALWIALSSHYPMAFDEDFHMGVIKLYAHHLSPFWGSAHINVDQFGAVARDPSYLYQWLMSFPYRLLSVFTHSQSAIVIGLRLINIALFAASLPLYRRLLLRTGASRAMVHACLLVFVLLPVVPLLAAQVNYDNAFVPLVAWLLLLTLRVKDSLQHEKLPLGNVGLLLSVGMLASLVKYAFLPIFLVMLAYLAVVTWRVHGPRKSFTTAWRAGWRSLSAASRWLLLGLLIVSSVLFVERYGINTIRYHTPIPDCADVLTVQQCSAYGPWSRDYGLNLQNTAAPAPANPVNYTGEWFYGMWLRTFFALSGPLDNYQTRSPLPVPAVGVITVAALAMVMTLVKFRGVWTRYSKSALTLFIAVTVFYAGSLWVNGYKAYLYTGQPVAINGRYLLPVLPLVMIIGALGIYESLKRRPRVLLLTALLIFLVFAWGGGAWTYIIRSNDSWYWKNSVVLNANHAVQHVLWPITPGADQPTTFLR